MKEIYMTNTSTIIKIEKFHHQSSGVLVDEDLL